jgi:CMP-N-acetylneuraminic acid synthetase
MQKKSIYGNSIGYVESDPDRYVNIDTMDDWHEAERLAIKLFGPCVE